MNERNRLSTKQFRDEQAALEAAEREERERPIREAEAKLVATHRKIAALEIERLTGKVKDPDRFVDPSVTSVQMTASQAHDFNMAEVIRYRSEHPEVYWCPELVGMIGAYLDYNALQIITASMIDNVVSRLGNVGLLPERPVEPKPDPIEEQPEPEQPREREKHIGIDLSTGEQREFSDFEVEKMSADEFRKVFRPFKGNPLANAFSRYR
jgi:hypothetical protein